MCIFFKLHYIFLFFLFCRLPFHLLVQLAFQSVITDPLHSSTLAPSNLLFDLNLNINLNPETSVHDDMHNVKYRQINYMNQHCLNPLNKLELVALC